MSRRPPAERTLNAVRPPAPARAELERRLVRELDEMNRSLVYWLKAQWRRDNPVANDASPVAELRKLLRRRGRLWRLKFAELAPILAKEFTGKTRKHVDRAISAMLRDDGVTIRFRLSRELNNVVQASIGAQVALITDLADEHAKRVEGYVMRAVQNGQDLKRLTDDLEEGLGIARRRAAFIARDQTAKTTATIARTRHMELGCTEAFWLHSAGGRKPRPEHVAYSGKRYLLAKGAYLEGKWVHPGEEPNCKCVSRPILPTLAGVR